MAIPWDDIGPEIQEQMKRKSRGEVQMSPTALQEYKRQEEEWWQEVKRMQLAAVQKIGYSSLEAAEEALLKEDMEREAEARIRVEKETGKTWDEYWATHPQQQKTPPELLPPCDCDGMYTCSACYMSK